MLENPLANFFGGNKPEQQQQKGGALTNGVDALLKDAPLPVKVRNPPRTLSHTQPPSDTRRFFVL